MIDRWTLGVCAARVFLFATFMTVPSVIPLLIEEWEISAAQAGSVVTAFTGCYAVSLFAFAWAADHLGAKRTVVVSALASAASSALFAFLARDWLSALFLYGLIGLTQGGVYTPVIMLFVERSNPARRGTAMGWLIASTSVGYATSLFLAGLALGFGGYRAVFIVTGLAPLLGAVLLVLCLQGTANRIHPRPAKLRIGDAVFGGREGKLLTAGYTAHCWELLGSWAWLPALIAAGFVMNGSDSGAASQSSAWSTGLMHLLGAAAAFTMGSLSDRLGRRAVLIGVAAGSAALSFALGWMVIAPVALLVALALVYAFLTIGDSPVLTTAITEVTEPGRLGATLATRSLLGFGTGAAAPLAAGVVFDGAAALGLPAPAVWGCTFGLLGMGGLIAALCAARLKPDRRAGA
jgi:MFS family permease